MRVYVGGGDGLTHVGAVTEEVHAQLQPHAVVTLVISELHERRHFLERGKGPQSLLIVWCLGNRPADPPEVGWKE